MNCTGRVSGPMSSSPTLEREKSWMEKYEDSEKLDPLTWHDMTPQNVFVLHDHDPDHDHDLRLLRGLTAPGRRRRRNGRRARNPRMAAAAEKILELFLKNSKSIECKTSWEKIDNIRVIGVQVEPADLLLHMIIFDMVIIIITMIMIIIMVMVIMIMSQIRTWSGKLSGWWLCWFSPGLKALNEIK